MSICRLCNGSMVVGDGNAMFSGECSHSFHFNCIVTYANLGNKDCPVCRAVWKNIPSNGPAPNPYSGPAPYGPPPPPIWNWEFKPQTPSSEPLIFNDDDQLDIQSRNFSPNNNSIIRSLNIKTHTEFPAVPRSSSQENFHILVNLKSHVSDSCRAPIDLVTVLDVSYSMEGRKLQLLKQAMGFVIENLGPSDRLSIITFSTNARRLFPLLLMTDSGKIRALEAVNSLAVISETNIVEGLKKGAKVIEDRAHKNPVCSIMLLSDGQDSFTKTINIKEISRLQIPVHTFGFGADHDPVMLHSIAVGSKGTFSFLEDEGIIQDAFAQRIGGLFSVAVQDVKVHIQSLDPNLCVSQLKAGGYSTDLTGDKKTGSVDIGDLYAGEERDFLVLLNVPVVADGNSNDPMKLVSVRCSYKNPFTKESVTTEAVEVKLRRPEMVANEDMVVSIEVDRQKNRLQAAEAMSNSRAAAERGDLPRARSIINSCMMQMEDTVSMHAHDEVSVCLASDLEGVQQRMQTPSMYAATGRAHLFAGMSSHLTQKAAARGNSTDCIYQTAPMMNMVQLSRASRPNSSPTDSTHKNSQQEGALCRDLIDFTSSLV
ncbi:hypothetical protein MKW94_023574 [Papaver nudicaule]|uniref:Anaphase-promoting complex subunit 11 n=1 Tax=Papaver nudicaule TaxID=74823 RepID=A0AA41SCE5_PAPNU|nr:hypothetical protein [Papaver nudicaule]